MPTDPIATNRAYWNHLADIHFDSGFYDNPGFLAGRNSLNAIELDLLGEDLAGLDVLHLQCHFGQDTLSLARLGARVTGLDLSDTAIARARELARQAGLEATFVRANVLDMDQYLDRTYDLIFSSYGTIGWLPGLTRWGQLIGQFLKPGGRFVFAEFHPVVWMLDDGMTRFQYSYFNREVIAETVQGSYAVPQDTKQQACYSWNHSLADVFNALRGGGLQLTRFEEYDYSPYDCFARTVKTDQGYQIKGLEGKMPMVYALEARK
jgi:2-polyprenyl-3-methyl-5-hydroxy-6-metoxy-1,4-benzoquinol methylase